MAAKKETMFQKVTKWVALISLLLGIFSTVWGYYQMREKNRYKTNYELSVSKCRTYTDKNGILVKEVETLQLTKNDLRNSNDSVIKALLVQLDASKLKLRKTESMLFMNMTTNNNFGTKIKYDTILTFMDSLAFDTVLVKKMTFKDNWIDFSCILPINENDSAQVKITTFHSIFVSNSWYKEDTWKLKNLIFWRKKHYKCDVKDLNPYSTIQDIKSVNVGRKK